MQKLTESQRLAYLSAMDIDVFVPRDVAAVAPLDATTPLGGSLKLSVPAPEQRHDDEAVSSAPIAAETATPSVADAARRWALLQHDVQRCTQCRLHETRTRPVFGSGSRFARLLIIGEAPGAEEDKQGEPFVGPAGQMLTSMLSAIGLARDAVFIANVLKCRPPQNRDPRGDEMASCRGYLTAQIAEIQPEVILAVGRFSAQQLLDLDQPLGKLRGKAHTLPGDDIPVVVTYHPAYLLRTPAAKAKTWQDLKRVHALLGAQS
ncbi:MAG: uracil-DNA glycosylase [Pseudomonadota bacterium]